MEGATLSLTLLEADLTTMDAPTKYKKLGDFTDFYRRQVYFPYLVYFIGGDREPYGFLDDFSLALNIVNEVCCLANVQKGTDAVAFFQKTSQGEIIEITNCKK